MDRLVHTKPDLLTDTEAAEIVRLLMERRERREEEASRTSVLDVVEVTGASEVEVRQVLQEMRERVALEEANSHVETPLERKRPRWVIPAVAGVLSATAILAWSFITHPASTSAVIAPAAPVEGSATTISTSSSSGSTTLPGRVWTGTVETAPPPPGSPVLRMDDKVVERSPAPAAPR